MSTPAVTLSVLHHDPVHQEGDRYDVRFWLRVKVDTGEMVGYGTGPEVEAQVYAGSVEEARRMAFTVEKYAERRVQSLDLADALARFPAIIDDLTSIEESTDETR